MFLGIFIASEKDYSSLNSYRKFCINNKNNQKKRVGFDFNPTLKKINLDQIKPGMI